MPLKKDLREGVGPGGPVGTVLCACTPTCMCVRVHMCMLVQGSASQETAREPSKKLQVGFFFCGSLLSLLGFQ